VGEREPPVGERQADHRVGGVRDAGREEADIRDEADGSTGGREPHALIDRAEIGGAGGGRLAGIVATERIVRASGTTGCTPGEGERDDQTGETGDATRRMEGPCRRTRSLMDMRHHASLR
jgi:hypothetical protein